MVVPAVFKFINWITGTPVPIDDAMASALTPTVDSALDLAIKAYLSSINARGYPPLYAGDSTFGMDPNNTAAENTTALNAAIASAGALSILTPMGGAIVILPHGYHEINNLNTISYNNLRIKGQGRFVSGTWLQFMETTGDSIVFSSSGHMGIEDVYISYGVNRTSGFSIKLTGQTFESDIRRVRIDYGWNGIWIDDSSNCNVDTVTMRHMLGTAGLYVFGLSSGVFGWFVDRLDTDNPYISSVPLGARSNWAAATPYIAGDIVLRNSHIYQALSITGGGVSGGTGPSAIPGSTGDDAFTTTIVDGEVTWLFISNAMTWAIQDSQAYSGVITNSALLDGYRGFSTLDTLNTGTSYPKWFNCFNLQIDHSYDNCVSLEKGSGFYGSSNWWGSSLTNRGVLITNLGDVHIGEGTRIVGNWADGILIQPTPKQVRICSCLIAQNSQAGATTYNGITVAAAATDFAIVNNAIGTGPDGSGGQGYGVIVTAGASDRYIITNNLIAGNATAGVLDGGVGVNKNVSNNY